MMMESKKYNEVNLAWQPTDIETLEAVCENRSRQAIESRHCEIHTLSIKHKKRMNRTKETRAEAQYPCNAEGKR